MTNSKQPTLLVISRYRVGEPESFADDARRAIAVLAGCDGFLQAAIGQSTDEADVTVITMRWTNVGSYRRALSRFEVKTDVVPLLSQAIDESTAYEVVYERSPEGIVEAVSGLAADADTTMLGHAAAPQVPPVMR